MNSISEIKQSALYQLLRQVKRRSIDAVQAATRVTKNGIKTIFASSDYRRWDGTGNLEVWWDRRTEQLAALVPAGSNVIEFGAGRRQLGTLLAAGCSYTPSDLVDRGPGTIVCDLNIRPLPDLNNKGLNVAVFGGVLEYIRDVPAVIQWLADSNINLCIASFDTVPARIGPIKKLREMSRRSYYGYMNNLTEMRLLESFQQAGFVCKQNIPWTHQNIYCFVKGA